MKVKLFSLIFFFAAFIFSISFFFMRNSNDLEGKLCLSTVKYKVESGADFFTYTVYFRLFFRGNGIGYVDARGVVTQNNSEFILSRNLTLSYVTPIDNNHFEVKVDESTKIGQDNVPDFLIEKYLPYIMADKKSHFRIDKIEYGRFIISAIQGPFLICSSTSE